jgi:hypothetical protein
VRDLGGRHYREPRCGDAVRLRDDAVAERDARVAAVVLGNPKPGSGLVRDVQAVARLFGRDEYDVWTTAVDRASERRDR